MMKKLLFNLLLLLMVAIGAVAQTSTLMVNDGAATSEKIPLDGWNADGAQHNQMLYLASEITAMNGMEIPLTYESSITEGDVTYRVMSSSNTYTGTFNVYMF